MILANLGGSQLIVLISRKNIASDTVFTVVSVGPITLIHSTRISKKRSIKFIKKLLIKKDK